MSLDCLSDIDRDSKQTLQVPPEIFEQAKEVKTTLVCLNIDEKVDVALRISFAAGD